MLETAGVAPARSNESAQGISSAEALMPNRTADLIWDIGDPTPPIQCGVGQSSGTRSRITATDSRPAGIVTAARMFDA